MEDFDFNDTAPVPFSEQEFLMENLCVRKGRAPGGYEPPATRSAAKRWKHNNEQNMMAKLNGMHIIKKQNAQMSKEAAREIIRKIPVELLAKEWLSKEDATVDMRAYLVDHVLPTLILGIERLLKEVDEKGLSATNRFEPEFNPINFLAQYLMRNNPRFSNFAEASPYVRGLREVSEEIKQELFTFEDNRLARIKAEARRKRTDRERHEQQIREGKEHRHNQLISQFTEWTQFTGHKHVPLSFLQNALRSFIETVELLPPELQELAKFGHPLESTDETGKHLNLKEFAEYISLFVEDLPNEVFQLFMIHMSKCAATRKEAANRNNRRIILTNLFLICDYGELRFMIADRKLGLLDRARILTLFEDFWDNLMDTKEPVGTLLNPRRWPIVEVEEVDDILFDAWYDEPDGGVSENEIQEQRKYLEDIRSALLQEAEIAAARNKTAREKWKKEQLEHKSEGYRVKLYKYNATDFMNLIQYPFLDTMEAPIRYFDNTDGRLTKDHDLYASTITRTARERSKKPLEDDSFVFVKALESRISSTTPKGSSHKSIAVTEDLLTSSTGKKDQHPTKPEKIRRPSRRYKDQNSSSCVQDVDLKDNDDSLSDEPFNRNNNKFGSDENSSDDTEDNSKGYYKAKTKTASKQRKRIKRNVGFSGISDESSEETVTMSKPPLKFRQSPFPSSSEDENVPQRFGSYSFPKQLLLKSRDSISSEDDTLYRRASPTTLPPVRMHKNVDDGGRSMEIMRELVASQTRLLGSKAVTASPFGTIKEKVISDKFPVPVKDSSSEILGDSNYNKEFENINASSCVRGRQIHHTSSSKDHVQLSSFTEIRLDLPQFVQLIENFIGPKPDDKVFATLVRFITDGYQDIESEKTELLLQFRDKANFAKKKAMQNALFEKWDNDGSGFLELEDVADVMFGFKDGQEIEAIKLGQTKLKLKSEFHDNRLSKKEFRQFINLVVEELPGEETFNLFVKFLMDSVERSYAERIRGEARKKWINQINIAAQTSGTSMDHVYKAVFQALYKDAETHGGEKRISASIAMLEVNKLEPSRGELLLRYAACTPEDCQYMLGKPMYKNMKGVSFQAVDTGKPVHIPRVASHGSVYFWNYDRKPADRGGSFIALPLKDNKKRVFGVLGVDTMIDPNKETIFITHEINFFQGVAKAFSIAYQLVEKKRKFLRVLESAISWFHSRCPHILEIEVYFVEPSTRVAGDYVLRKMMVKGKDGAPVHISELIRLERKDNMFRKYLFDCMETSETSIADIHQSRHLACPIRDNKGIAIGIVDLNSGYLKILPHYERREAQRMLRLLSMAHSELIDMSKGDAPACVLEAERDPTVRTEIMFERVMLQELRDNIIRLDSQSYIDIKAYVDPPRVIVNILRATMAIFKIDQVGEGEYDDWDDLKNCINSDLIQQINTFDPTAFANISVAEKIEKYLKATFSVSFGEISEQGSIPAQQLYNWITTCLSLIEHMLRIKESNDGTKLVAVGTEGKASQTTSKQKI